MTQEDLKISELGAYTNNSMNKEGLKKLVEKVNSGGGTVDAYTKAETDALLDDKQDVLTAGTNITIVDNVISANGGGGSGEWTVLTSDAEITQALNDKKDILLVMRIKTSDIFYRCDYLLRPINKGAYYGPDSPNLTLSSHNTSGDIFYILVCKQLPKPGNYTYNLTEYKISIDASTNTLTSTKHSISGYTIKYDDLNGNATHDDGFRFYIKE